jgi:hypothetical protein
MIENSLLIVSVVVFYFLIIFAVIFFIDRCPKGQQHDYELMKSEYIHGNDIGFGIYNSYTRLTYKCKKCNEIIDSIT